MSDDSPMEPAMQYRSGKRVREEYSPGPSPASPAYESPDTPQQHSMASRPAQPSMLSPFLSQMSVHNTPHSSAAARQKWPAELCDASAPATPPAPPPTPHLFVCASGMMAGRSPASMGPGAAGAGSPMMGGCRFARKPGRTAAWAPLAPTPANSQASSTAPSPLLSGFQSPLAMMGPSPLAPSPMMGVGMRYQP